ncbi:hypothetical protein EON80_11590 [bacterium]|nr:MAG: hypothetical protein EON80_11590 [bacterium]
MPLQLPVFRIAVLALCCAATVSVADAAPKKKIAARSSAEQEFQRVLSAYRKLGSFSLTSNDTMQFGTVQMQGQSTGNMASDGRRSLRAEMSARVMKVSSGDEIVKLYDGTNLTQLSGRMPLRTFAPAQLKREKFHLENFFATSMGLHVVASIFETGNPIRTLKSRPPFTARSIGKGFSELNFQMPRTGIAANSDVRLILTISPEGYIQSVESRERELDTNMTHILTKSFLSKPRKIDPKAVFDWNRFMPSEPLIVGQPEVPPIVPEIGKMGGGTQ